MDEERSRRHASKLLTYPITIGSVLHQHSNLTLSNERLTSEGSRSLAGMSHHLLKARIILTYLVALRTTLHVAPGAPETEEATAGKPQMRIFILGARGESSLPPHVWDQLTLLFPAAQLHLFFIGPQVSLPRDSAPAAPSSAPPPTGGPTAQPNTGSPEAPPPAASASTATATFLPGTTADAKPNAAPGPSPPAEASKPAYVPNVYEPPTPAAIQRLRRTRSSIEAYGVPSYTVPYTPALTITGLQASYMDVHAQFQETFDPYTDCFFLFSPGFGFPSPTAVPEPGGSPVLQIASPTEWGPVLPTLLASKCAIFVTGFSPADVERDVKSLATAPGVAGEFDWVITPGPNAFGSEKWEIADFDPRVMVKTNWGIWGIRGKRREVRERSSFTNPFSS